MGNNNGGLGVLLISRVIWRERKRSGGIQQEVLKRLYIVCDRLEGKPFSVHASKTIGGTFPHREWQAPPDRKRFAGVKSIEWRGRAMKFQPSAVRNSLFIFAVMVALAGVRASGQMKPDSSATSQSAARDKQSKVQPALKPVPHDDQGREAIQEGPEFLRRRQDWFFKPRSFPIGFIPQGARERALEQKRQMYQREGRLGLFAAPSESGFLTPPLGPTSAWFPIGPQATSTTFFAPFTSGRVTALVVNPNNANNVYLGGADGGLWMTTDGGTNWTPITDFPLSSVTATIAVGALAVDPTSCTMTICTTVYVGTGEGNFGAENVYGEGVLKCTVTAGVPPTAACAQDNTFHAVSPLSSFRGGPSIGALAVNRAAGKSNILLAGVRGLGGTTIPSGIWCSADSGVTWSRVLPTSAAASDPGTDVAFANDGTAWVALGNPFGDAANNGVYKSSAVVASCTITFTKQPLPAALSTNIGRITLALAPSSDATLYAAIADSSTTSSNLLGVAKTTNATSAAPTWLQLSGDPRLLAANGICNSQCFYDIPMAVSPASPTTVFLGGAARNGTVIRSIDGGTTWTEISRNDVAGATDSIHVDMHAFAFSSNGATMFVGNDGGVWKTSGSPSGAAGAGFWTNLNQTLQITQFYPGVSIHPSNSGFAMGGTQDNDVQIYQGFTSPSANLSWKAAEIGCDGGFTAIDFNVPSTSYGECEYIPNNPPFPIIAVTFAGDGILGNGFQANVGIDPADRGSFIPPLVMDPNNSNTLYFGTCRIWQTTDGANSWSAISPDVTNAAHAANCSNQSGFTLSTIAIAKGTSNTIYVGSEGGEVEVSSNGGANWTNISANGGTLPGRAVTQIVVDPSNATGDVAYVAFSGFASCTGCDGKGHVFKTVNGTGGATTAWTDVSGVTTKLPDIPVNAIVIDPDDPAHITLYVGTDVGAFFTTDGGLNWSPLGAANSLPNSQILSLTLHNPSRTLRAATHGRGVWDLSLGGAAAFSIASISPFSANAGAASITNFTVNGSGFTSSSTAKFSVNGTTTSLATNCPTAISCTATILANQLQNGGAASVTVTNTTPADTTNAVPFTILNPVPVINSISPTTTTTGTTNFSLTANGSKIICGANGTVVLFNSSPRTNITACSSTSVTVKLPDSDLTTAASVPIDLFTSQPGGGPTFNTPPTLTITQANNPVPTVTTISPTSAVAGGNSFALTVNGTNFINTSNVTFGTNAGLVPTSVTATQITVTIPASAIAAAGTPVVFVTNPSPGGGPSNSVNFTVNSGGTFTVTGGSGTITATPGTTPDTVTIPITVTPSGGFTGAVAITCAASGTPSGFLPLGASCNPLSIPVNGAIAVQRTLTVSLTAPSAALSASASPAERKLYTAGVIPSTRVKGWWTLSASTGLAAMLLLFLPGRKKYRMALGLGLICVLSFTLGCGYGGGGGGGPVATTTTLAVTPATKNPTQATITVTPYSGAAPQGSVTLADLTSTQSSTVTINNGIGLVNLALAGTGTHTLQAKYAGTATDAASQSKNLNVTITGGPQSVTITGTSGPTTATGTINVTIN